MATLNLKALVGKLNPTCRRALEAAAGLCLSRTNYNVELEHWLLKLLEPSDTDLPRVLQHYEIDKAKVSRELTRSLDQLKTGNARARPSTCRSGPPTKGDAIRWTTVMGCPRSEGSGDRGKGSAARPPTSDPRPLTPDP